ncbi:hypothetical protein LCGC14_2634940, partial [marine sediment metagenome]
MSINARQLEKDIDAIPGICDEGKGAIKKLFENNFGVKFEHPREFKVGAVYIPCGVPDDPYMLTKIGHSFALVGVS